MIRRLLPLALLVASCVSLAPNTRAARPEPSIASDRPDPASVVRHGPAYRYPRAGWIVVHIEGKPYDRGYQHGLLLSREIVDYVNTLAGKRSHRDPAAVWREVRTMVDALFLRRYDPEYLEEMKGIADGASAAGARFQGRPLDLLDIASVNSDIELEFLDAALNATPNGLESKTFREPSDLTPSEVPPEHCSAFAATGPATADGKIVFGHITMFSLHFARHFNVWLDVKPENGRRVLMQTYPGGIQSGMDYYMNDAGMVVAETTIRQTKFDLNGQALASRIRKALQYSESIDQVVATLHTANNGMYTNEWLIADTKTNEIAMFELGTHRSKLWRSSKDEWFGGTKGFYWGCNNPKDLNVRLETTPSVEGRPANLVYHPSDRDLAWLKLYEKHRGKIDASFGFEAFTTPPLAAFPSLDAKFTTSDMAKELKTWAVFGPPLGKTWDPSEAERARYQEVQPLIPNDWTILTAEPPALKPDEKLARAERRRKSAGLPRSQEAQVHRVQDEVLKRVLTTIVDAARPSEEERKSSDRQRSVARNNLKRPEAIAAAIREGLDAQPPVDLYPSRLAREPHPTADLVHPHPPAWHGTLLPAGEADAWLPAAFAEYERIVALERAIQSRATAMHREVTRGEREAIAIAAFAPFSQYRAAVARRGDEFALSETRPSLTDDTWYPIAAGKGVLLLQAIHQAVGTDAFLAFMDEFGRSHAGKEVSTAEFREAVERISGHDLKPILDEWLTRARPRLAVNAAGWSINAYEAQLDQAVIVYGTTRESDAQREAAERLQRQIQRKWSNILVPILADRDASPEALKDRHILLIGRPETNRLTAALVKGLPVTFGAASFQVGRDTYAHALSGVIAAGANPDDPRHEIVVFAGLSAEATWRLVHEVGQRTEEPAEVVIVAAGTTPRRLVVKRPRLDGRATTMAR